jgi:sulfotransferase
MKKIYAVAGLPRSGSTLLENILAQNPRFHATETSGMVDMVFAARNNFPQLIEHRASVKDLSERETNVLKGIVEGYYKDIDKPVIIDKSRAWSAYIEMMDNVLENDVKIIAPVRDLRQIMSSFEKLHRKNSHLMQATAEQKDYFKAQTVKGRVEMQLQNDSPTGLAFNRLQDALKRGHSDKILFVDFDDLTKTPKETMEVIYKFLGEEPFEHDFTKVEQVTEEDDSVHGIPDLHTIRNEVKPVVEDWKEIIGEEFDDLKNSNFWTK